MPVTPADMTDALNITEAAQVLHVSKRTMERLIGQREIDVLRIGRRVFITRRALTDYLNRAHQRRGAAS